MKWLEIIEVRSVDNNRDLLESQLRELIKDVEMESEKRAIKVYIHASLDTDFNIHLFHDSQKVEDSGSPLGLRIVLALKEVGLVSHTVWIEMQRR